MRGENLEGRVGEEEAVEAMKRDIVEAFVDRPGFTPTSDELRQIVSPEAHNYEQARREFSSNGVLKPEGGRVVFDSKVAEDKKYL